MLGTRTEEIPGELRITLSRDHTAVIVVLGIDTNQIIPFWTLVKNIPVRIRVNNFVTEEEEEEVDYMMFHTTHGLIRPTEDAETILDTLNIPCDSIVPDSLMTDTIHVQQ
jgi:hypothetical protein